MRRVGQNHVYAVYIRYFWQGNHQIYGHIQCIYTVLANPTHSPWTFAQNSSIKHYPDHPALQLWYTVTTNHGTSFSMDCKYEP